MWALMITVQEKFDTKKSPEQEICLKAIKLNAYKTEIICSFNYLICELKQNKKHKTYKPNKKYKTFKPNENYKINPIKIKI